MNDVLSKYVVLYLIRFLKITLKLLNLVLGLITHKI